MRKPKAILLDLDDTLISFGGVSDEAWDLCCDAFVKDRSLPFTTPALRETLDRVRNLYWSDPLRHKEGRHNLKEARRVIVRLALSELGVGDEILVRELADHYSSYRNELIRLFPDTVPVLTRLKLAGCPLGLITNGTAEDQRAKLKRFDLTRFFDLILIEQEVGFGKPDPRVYELAMQRLNLPASALWMVGDNLVWDVLAPKSLGLFTVWYDDKNTGLPPDTLAVPDLQIKNLSALAEFYEKSE
jgi:putative hydrolase of the HAD superfamily